MKRYVVGNTNAYNLVGDNPNDRQFIPTEGTFLASGRNFVGKLVFIPMSIGFQPVVKVLDPKLSKNVYYSPKDVKPISNEVDFPYGKPRAGAMGGNGYGVEAGVVKGDVRTAPQVRGEMSGFLGEEDYNYSTQLTGLKHYDYANVNVAPELDTYKNNYPQYSSANGGFLGKIFGSKKPSSVNSNIEEVSQEDLESIHKNSGSKMSFGDWLKTEQAKGLANNAFALGLALVNKGKDDEGSPSSQPNKKNEEEYDVSTSKDKSNTILGMHPLTFGVVTVGVLVVGAIAITLVRSKK